MGVTNAELADWAGDFAKALTDNNQAHHPKTVFQVMHESTSHVRNLELRHALTEVVKSSRTGQIFGKMGEFPDIFDVWFIAIFRYGMFYNELDVVMTKFAEKRDKLGITYFDARGGRCTPEAYAAAKAEAEEKQSQA